MYVHEDIKKINIICGECLRNDRKINNPAVDISVLDSCSPLLRANEKNNLNNIIVDVRWTLIDNDSRPNGIFKEEMFEMEEIHFCGSCQNEMEINGFKWSNYNRSTNVIECVICEYNVGNNVSCIVNIV